MENFDWFNWVIVPLLIFLARIFDVSLSTVRIMFVMSGRKRIAPVLGAIEVLIWLIAIGQIMQNLSNFMCYIAYAGGFAAGTYIGMRIEERLAFGNYIIRIITDHAEPLIKYLRENHYGVTALDAEGNVGPVNVIFLVIRRSKLDKVLGIIKRFNPEAFYTVGSIKYLNEGGISANNLAMEKNSLDAVMGTIKKSK